jgi:SAM-dependent methyltransferase
VSADRRKQTVEAGYDELAPRFGEWAARVEGDPWERFLDELAGRLAPGARVLDLGCGRAITSIFLAKEFDVQVVAADLWIKPTENWRRIDAAGQAKLVTPLLAEAQQQIQVASVQNELSPYALESLEVVLACHRQELPFIAWAPFGGARRAGSLGGDPTTAVFATCARDVDVPVNQLVLAWLLSLSSIVTVIPGASRPESIRRCAMATGLELDPSTLQRLDRHVLGTGSVGAAWLADLRSEAAP